MLEIDLKDTSYIKDKSRGISIQVDLNGFSFCTYAAAQEKKEIRSFKHYNFDTLVDINELTDQVKKILTEDDSFKQDYEKVDIIYNSKVYTILPNKFFKEEHLKKHLEFGYELGELDVIQYNNLKGIDSKLIFTLPNYLFNLFFDSFSNAQFYNQVTPLFNGHKEEADRTKKAYLILNKSFFDMVVYKDNKLILSNKFDYKDPEDLIYLVLNAIRRLDMSEKEVDCYISGSLAYKYEFRSILKDYMKQVEYHKPRVILPFSFYTLDAYRFYSLLSLAR